MNILYYRIANPAEFEYKKFQINEIQIKLNLTRISRPQIKRGIKKNLSFLHNFVAKFVKINFYFFRDVKLGYLN